jgi:CBS domain containing-hemolysin-like protein
VVAQPLAAFDLVFRPAVLALNGAGRAVTRLLGLRPPAGHELVHSAEELKMLVEASGRAGALEESEREIIYRAFDFADFAAHEVMVPRTEMVAVAADTPGSALLRLVRDAGYSRYPVYEGSLDQVIGILHVRDLLDAVLENRLERVTARDLAREALFVPDSLPVDELLHRMREQGTTIAVVLDEFGGTAGLVTLENVLERLVGSLRDEFEREREPEVQPLPDGSTLISGLTLISDVNEMFGLDLDDREYDTIGGYIFGTLGRLPKPGDVVPVTGYDLRVERMDGRRVDRVRVIPRPERREPADDKPESSE